MNPRTAALQQHSGGISVSPSPAAQPVLLDDSDSEDDLPLAQVMAQRLAAAPSSMPPQQPTVDTDAAAAVAGGRTDLVQPAAAVAEVTGGADAAAYSPAGLQRPTAATRADAEIVAAETAFQLPPADALTAQTGNDTAVASDAPDKPTASLQDHSAGAVRAIASHAEPVSSWESAAAPPSQNTRNAGEQPISGLMPAASGAGSGGSLPGAEAVNITRHGALIRWPTGLAGCASIEPTTHGISTGAALPLESNCISQDGAADHQQELPDVSRSATLLLGDLSVEQPTTADSTDAVPASLLQRADLPLCSASIVRQPPDAADVSEASPPVATCAGRAMSLEAPSSAWAEPLERLLDYNSQLQNAALLQDGACDGGAIAVEASCSIVLCSTQQQISTAGTDVTGRACATVVPDSEGAEP